MKTHSWLVIIAILIGVAIVSGLLFGLLGEWLGLSTTMKNAGIGVSVGIAAALLPARRQKAD